MKSKEEILDKKLQFLDEENNKIVALQMIEQGVDVNYLSVPPNKAGQRGTALHSILNWLNKKQTEYKKNKSNGNFSNEKYKKFEKDAIEIVEKLLAKGINPNRIHNGWAAYSHPLHFAIGLRNIELVKLLLEAGADPYMYVAWVEEVKGFENRTPLNAIEAAQIHNERSNGELKNILNLLIQVASQRAVDIIKIKKNEVADFEEIIEDEISPLFRLYFNQQSNVDNFYTTDIAEQQEIINKQTYNNLGKMGYVLKRPPNAAPIYRLYNEKLQDHYYTCNEKQAEIAIKRHQYKLEKIEGYIYQNPQEGTIPVYQLYHEDWHDHCYTTSKEERNSQIQKYGYKDDGILGYIYLSEKEFFEHKSRKFSKIKSLFFSGHQKIKEPLEKIENQEIEINKITFWAQKNTNVFPTCPNALEVTTNEKISDSEKCFIVKNGMCQLKPQLNASFLLTSFLFVIPIAIGVFILLLLVVNYIANKLGGTFRTSQNNNYLYSSQEDSDSDSDRNDSSKLQPQL